MTQYADPIAMRFVQKPYQCSSFKTSFQSVRSTNVYEEQSLGIFHDAEDEEEAEEGFETSGVPRISVWSRYLAMHARRQLAFGKFFVLYGS